MTITLAFDVYGTLIDTHGVVEHLKELIGEKAAAFSRTWRDKQLEYSFRRGLMQHYAPFSVCTAQALDYTCVVHGIPFNSEQKKGLLEIYRTLPAFPDVREGLARLKATDCNLFAFSNGTADAVETLLNAAGIRDAFHGIVSVDEIKSFKPNPGVYAHFLRKSGAARHEAWLISSNPFDVIGALSAGMRAAWVNRSKEAPFDPWGIEPSATIHDLTELRDALSTP